MTRFPLRNIAEPAPGSTRPARDPSATRDAHALRQAVAHHRTLDALRGAPEWPALEARFAALLGTARRYRPRVEPAPARDARALHVVHWNIEHGNWYEQVERALRTDAALAGADLLLLNEVDLGMARAGNRDVTGDLADALGLHAVWAPQFMESTTGRDDDATTAAGRDNEESLFGLAILSRWPISNLQLVPLPGPERIQFDLERMVGRFVALVARVERPSGPFIAVSVHLEVHRTRAHRAAQIAATLQALADVREPVVLAGDFNAHTFDRGLWHSHVMGALPLLTWPAGALRERLLRPDRGAHREPLFAELARAGFAWASCADFAPTLQLRFDRLDEVNALPAPLRAAARRVLVWAERRATLRLDWFATRGFTARRGVTVGGWDGRGKASDHAPIAAWLEG